MSALIATLRDNFTDNAISPAWDASALGSSTVAETGGQARFTLPSSAGVGPHTARYTSRSTYDLTGGSFFVNIDTMVATGVAATAFFQLYLNGSNALQWIQLSNTLYARSLVAGVSTDVYSVTWSAATYKYLRVREAGGNILWDSSTNGTSWTNRAVVAVSSLFAITDLRVDFGATCGNIASPGSFRLEDVNLILPALTTTWRWQQCVWPLTERNKTDTIAIDTAGTAQGYLTTADGVDVNGDPSGNVRYWSGPADGGRVLTEQATEAAAQAMAVDLPLDGRFDLPTIIEARCYRLNDRSIDGSAYTLREFYPRRLVQADDIEAESIKALHVAAASITADRLVAHTITANEISTIDLDATARITAGGGALTLDDTGITAIITAASYVAASAYKFTKANGTLLSDLYAQSDTGTHAITLDTESIASEDSTTFITAHAPSTFQARVQIAAYAVAPTTQTSITLTSDSDATNPSQIVSVATTRHLFQGSNVTIEEGLNVGTATGAGAGVIRASGALQANYGGATNQIQAKDHTSLANAGTAQLLNEADALGIIIISDSGGRNAIFAINGAAHTTSEIADPSTVFSAASGTASMTNIYWSAGNARYEIQNNTGATRTYKIHFLKF
jgi:hypothetical protein